jgi:hypothetical protein
MSVIEYAHHLTGEYNGEHDFIVAPWVRLNSVYDCIHLSEIGVLKGIVDRSSLAGDDDFKHLAYLRFPSDFPERNRLLAPLERVQARLDLAHEIGIRQHSP